MDRAKIFKDYFVSRQNAVLIPNEEFGRRKFLNVGINRSLSLSRIEEINKNHTAEMRSGMLFILCLKMINILKEIWLSCLTFIYFFDNFSCFTPCI